MIDTTAHEGYYFFVRKLFYFTLVFAFFLFPKTANAGLVVVKQSGEVIVNVLSVQDGEGVEMTEEPLETLNLSDTLISLSTKDERSYLSLGLPEGDRVLDVTDYGDDILEVEGETARQKLTISKKENKFSILQDGLTVITDFEITIDPGGKKLLVATPTGKKYLLVFPQEAALSLLRSNLVTKIEKEKEINMSESEGDLAYEIVGKKFFEFFGVFGFDVDVATLVSATNGQVLSVTSPGWMRAFSSVLI